MTIDKAIELLDTAKEGFPVKDDEEYYKAMELGIEALKRLEEGRKRGYDYFGHLLPGETEE
uniref:Uncharacterized protein n=1 Tax=viral metagenome TaxID=1070528 RepID=A0A6M3XWA1_9ZZZZ